MEYVRVCNVGGITGWTLPGSDTCVKFSGYMTAHVIGGNLSSQYNDASAIASTIEASVNPFASAHLQQTLMVQGSDVSPTVFNGTAHDITLPSGAVIAPGARSLRGALWSPYPIRRMRFSIAARRDGTSAPISALISPRTRLTAH